MAMTSLLGVYNCLQASVKPSAPLETQSPLNIHKKHSLPCLEYPRHRSGIAGVVYTKVRQHSPVPARKDYLVGLVQQRGEAVASSHSNRPSRDRMLHAMQVICLCQYSLSQAFKRSSYAFQPSILYLSASCRTSSSPLLP